MSRIAVLCLVPIAGGCAMPEEMPGELVGAYRINGALMENTCGSAALPAADPLRFDVEIRKQDGSGLWLAAAPPPHLGSLTDDGEFSFERQSTYEVGARQPVELLIDEDIERLADPEVAQQLGAETTRPCRLMVTERIAGTLLRVSTGDEENGTAREDEAREERATAAGADLIGENEIGVRAASGSDCAASLEDNGGPFEDLPCTARYELEGELLTR